MRRPVIMAVSPNFYNRFDLERRKIQAATGVKNLSQYDMSNLLAAKFPNIKINIGLKPNANAYRKKRTA